METIQKKRVAFWSALAVVCLIVVFVALDASILGVSEEQELGEAYREMYGDTEIGVEDFAWALPGELLSLWGQRENIWKRFVVQADSPANRNAGRFFTEEERADVHLPTTAQYISDAVREGTSFGGRVTRSFNPEGRHLYAHDVIEVMGSDSGYIKTGDGTYIPRGGSDAFTETQRPVLWDKLTAEYDSYLPSAEKSACD